MEKRIKNATGEEISLCLNIVWDMDDVFKMYSHSEMN